MVVVIVYIFIGELVGWVKDCFKFKVGSLMWLEGFLRVEVGFFFFDMVSLVFYYCCIW